MTCHVWINLVLSDIIDYADRNDLTEVGQALRETAARVAPLLEAGTEPPTEDGTFDLFPLDLRRALSAGTPRASRPPGRSTLRRVV